MSGLLLAFGLLLPAAALDGEAEAAVQVGWLEYGDLWSGDAILGGFDLRSPPSPWDRLLVAPRLSLAARFGAAHRLRVTASGRTLSRVTLLDDDLAVVHTLTSDGVPVAEAWRERLFLDEASWRWRPAGDPALDLRAGILPYAVAGGRLLAESWPGLRLRWDAARHGHAPLAVEARAATTLRGTGFAALSVGHEPSMFEFLGLEAAWTGDRAGGLAPLVEQDLGLMLDLWRGSSASFFEAYGSQALQGLYDLYGREVDGVRMLQSDLADFLDLTGRADLLHASALARVAAGPVLFDGAFVLGTGRATLAGQRFPDAATWEEVGVVDWATAAPREPFTAEARLLGWAFDLALTGLGSERAAWTVFCQGLSGDDALAEHLLAGEPVTAFLATDQRFVRTRLFPVDTAGASGSLALPPGVAGHGMLTPGAGVGLRLGPVQPSLQVALPLATRPSPLPPNGLIYGLEGDLIVVADLGERLGLTLEGGLFQPGTFFLDGSDPARASLTDLPTGWRVFGGISARARDLRLPSRLVPVEAPAP